MKAEPNAEVSERFQKFGLALVVVVGIVAQLVLNFDICVCKVLRGTQGQRHIH